jgi:ATP-dependent protease HslVU (ClpYQ) peptidase subunit
MTTIVATREAIGGDTMVSCEAKAIFYPSKKVMRIKNDLIGAAGDAGDCVRFLDWAKHDFAEKKKPKFTEEAGSEDESLILLVNAEGIFTMSTTDPYPELIESDFFAIGSGGKAAMGAFHRGATIEEALAIAAKVDPYTREPFHFIRLKEPK